MRCTKALNTGNWQTAERTHRGGVLLARPHCRANSRQPIHIYPVRVLVARVSCQPSA